MYGRTFQREFSVEEAVAMKKWRLQESRARAAETLQRRRKATWAKGLFKRGINADSN